MPVSMKRIVRAGCAAFVLAAPASTANAASCGNGPGGFNAWVGAFKSRAAGQGISGGALSALNGISYDSKVIHLDRNQHSFKLSFEQFYARRVDGGMIAKGRRLRPVDAATGGS